MRLSCSLNYTDDPAGQAIRKMLKHSCSNLHFFHRTPLSLRAVLRQRSSPTAAPHPHHSCNLHAIPA